MKNMITKSGKLIRKSIAFLVIAAIVISILAPTASALVIETAVALVGVLVSLILSFILDLFGMASIRMMKMAATYVQISPCVWAPAGANCTPITITTFFFSFPYAPPRDPVIQAINTVLIQWLTLFFMAALVYIGIYLVFMSGSPHGRSRAKDMFIRLVVGMVIVSQSPIIFQFMLDAVTSLSTQLIEEAITTTPDFQFRIAFWKNIKYCCTFIVFLFVLCVATFVAVLRYFAIFILASIWPLALFCYYFSFKVPFLEDIVNLQAIGRSLIKITIIVLLTQLMQVFFLAIGIIQMRAETGSQIMDFLLMIACFAGVIFTPMMAMQLLGWVGGIIHMSSTRPSTAMTRFIGTMMRGYSPGDALVTSSGQTMIGRNLGSHTGGLAKGPEGGGFWFGVPHGRYFGTRYSVDEGVFASPGDYTGRFHTTPSWATGSGFIGGASRVGGVSVYTTPSTVEGGGPAARGGEGPVFQGGEGPADRAGGRRVSGRRARRFRGRPGLGIRESLLPEAAPPTTSRARTGRDAGHVTPRGGGVVTPSRGGPAGGVGGPSEGAEGDATATRAQRIPRAPTVSRETRGTYPSEGPLRKGGGVEAREGLRKGEHEWAPQTPPTSPDGRPELVTGEPGGESKEPLMQGPPGGPFESEVSREGFGGPAGPLKAGGFGSTLGAGGLARPAIALQAGGGGLGLAVEGAAGRTAAPHVIGGAPSNIPSIFAAARERTSRLKTATEARNQDLKQQFQKLQAEREWERLGEEGRLEAEKKSAKAWKDWDMLHKEANQKHDMLRNETMARALVQSIGLSKQDAMSVVERGVITEKIWKDEKRGLQAMASSIIEQEQKSGAMTSEQKKDMLDRYIGNYNKKEELQRGVHAKASVSRRLNRFDEIPFKDPVAAWDDVVKAGEASRGSSKTALESFIKGPFDGMVSNAELAAGYSKTEAGAGEAANKSIREDSERLVKGVVMAREAGVRRLAEAGIGGRTYVSRTGGPDTARRGQGTVVKQKKSKAPKLSKTMSLSSSLRPAPEYAVRRIGLTGVEPPQPLKSSEISKKPSGSPYLGNLRRLRESIARGLTGAELATKGGLKGKLAGVDDDGKIMIQSEGEFDEEGKPVLKKLNPEEVDGSEIIPASEEEKNKLAEASKTKVKEGEEYKFVCEICEMCGSMYTKIVRVGK
jgi:hypothetical protein